MVCLHGGRESTADSRLMVGAGGIFADLLGDRAFRLAPLTVGDTEQMLDELRISPLLDGYRGGPTGVPGAAGRSADQGGHTCRHPTRDRCPTRFAPPRDRSGGEVGTLDTAQHALRFLLFIWRDDFSSICILRIRRSPGARRGSLRRQMRKSRVL